MPHMLVHAQDLHALESGRILCGPGQDGLDLGPERVPGRAELAGEPLDRGALAAELADRPPERAHGQQAPRRADRGILFDECHHRAGLLAADPAALAPPDPHGPVRPRSVDHRGHDPAVTSGDRTASRAARDRIAGLDLEKEPGPGAVHRDQVQSREAEEEVASVAAIERDRAGARRVQHCRGPWCEQR